MGRDPVFPNVSSGACLIERTSASRILTDAEARRILAVFDGVRIETETPPECGTEDPCLIDRFVWMNRRDDQDVATNIVADPCGPRLAESDARGIKDTLDDLLQ